MKQVEQAVQEYTGDKDIELSVYGHKTESHGSTVLQSTSSKYHLFIIEVCEGQGSLHS